MVNSPKKSVDPEKGIIEFEQDGLRITISLPIEMKKHINKVSLICGLEAIFSHVCSSLYVYGTNAYLEILNKRSKLYNDTLILLTGWAEDNGIKVDQDIKDMIPTSGGNFEWRSSNGSKK